MPNSTSNKSPSENDCVWCVDSSASEHTASKKKFFSTLNESENVNETLNVANGYPVKIFGKGDCCISVMNDEGVFEKLYVKDVLYMPSIRQNLLSVQKLTETGYKILFENGTCSIQKDNRTVAKADFVNGCYTLKVEIKQSKVSGDTCNYTECIHDWHRRMGHENNDVISKLLAHANVKQKSCRINTHCEICISGTIERISFHREFDKQSKNILDLVHIVNAYTNKPTYDGYVNFVIFIDDCSGYCVVYLLRSESDILNPLIAYISYVRNKFNKIPTILSAKFNEDCMTSRVKSYMTKLGIKQQFTGKSYLQSHELADHRLKSLSEMMRCMMLDANLPIEFWGEALKTANFIRNRISIGPQKKSPYEIWEMNSYDVRNFKAFGSEAWIWTRTKPGNVLKQSQNTVIFIGYDETTQALRFMDMEAAVIIISTNYKFIKTKQKKSSK